jgi:dTDP-4-amino-4,6-dideoxygalactose transaminase
LRIKLKHLSEWNEKRRRNASFYTQHLSPNTGITPHEPQWAKAVYHLYIIRTKKRDELQKYLSENGINTGLHYPIPLHLQKAYANDGFKQGDFPITEKVASEILSLPMYPELTTEQIEFIVQKIKEFYYKNPC